MDKARFTQALGPGRIRITDPFWKSYMELVKTQVIPYQWDALNDRIPGAEPSYCMRNFRVAAGMEEGEFGGMVFQDSDFAKWIEAVAFALMSGPDPALEKTADEAIDVVCAAQQPDGYLNTYYIINGLEKRWTNLMDHHELYCLGHMIEGAVAYFQATGKDKMLNAVIRYVDHVDGVFGPAPEKKKGYPGHEVIEMALVRLYDVTGDEKHLKLAKYFIDQRGRQPLFFPEECRENGNVCRWIDGPCGFGYYQADRPVREQTVAQGHAVRAVYLYSGMADVARKTGDQELQAACERLWDNIAERQMYITGGIGSSEYGEAFTFDYDLPNDTVYAETCASIGLMLFARRMLETEPNSKYADVMERALYNGVISGMSLDGNKFFYVNPLEAAPESSEKDQQRRHVKIERQKWFGCSCCPPNAARLLASIGSYAYTVNERSVCMHLYIGGEMEHTLDGKSVGISVETNYPWEGVVSVRMTMKEPTSFAYAVRIPGWRSDVSIHLDGKPAPYTVLDGYAILDREWRDGDVLELRFDMPVRVMQANPRVRADIGKVCVCRGPMVYCIEQADNGPDLHLVTLGGDPAFETAFEKGLLGGVVTITSRSFAVSAEGWDPGTLYRPDTGEALIPKTLKWIPYYAWTNREPGEMMVWVRR